MQRQILQNLIDFYISFSDKNTILENENFISFNNDWPNFNIVKTNKISNELCTIAKSKNWIITEESIQKNQEIIKKERLFPVNKWTNMYLKKENVFSLQSIPNFKVEKLKKSDLSFFLKLINSTIFKKEIINESHFKNKLQHPNFNIYVGKYHNEIVSTFVLFTNKQTAGVYFFTTKKTHQNKGFGTYTLKYVLNQQIQQKPTKFILHATNMATKIYKKIDFIACNKLHIFVKI